MPPRFTETYARAEMRTASRSCLRSGGRPIRPCARRGEDGASAKHEAATTLRPSARDRSAQSKTTSRSSGLPFDCSGCGRGERGRTMSRPDYQQCCTEAYAIDFRSSTGLGGTGPRPSAAYNGKWVLTSSSLCAAREHVMWFRTTLILERVAIAGRHLQFSWSDVAALPATTLIDAGNVFQRFIAGDVVVLASW